MYPKISKKVISTKAIDIGKSMVLTEIETLRNDYFTHLSASSFITNHIYPGSKMLKILQSRCFFNGLADKIISDDLLKFISKHINNFTLYHMAFLRVCPPSGLSNAYEKKDNVTSTPLHYDKYEFNTITSWIPLHNIDIRTGSLCYTTNKSIIKITGSGFAYERDFHDKKMLNESKYINLLKEHILTVNCKKGQAVIFDNKLLHGGTYSQDVIRISVDLRWIERNKHYARPGPVSQNLELLKKDMLVSLYLNQDYKFIYKRTLKLKYLSVHLGQNLRRIALLKKFVKFIKKIK